MNQNGYTHFLVAVCCLMSCALLAHEGGSTEHKMEGQSPGIVGAIELRPSHESGSGNLFGENIIEVGYQFSEKLRIGYQQEIHHNIRSNSDDPNHEPVGLHLETGTLNAQINKIWESDDERSSVSLEPRLDLPVSSEDRSKGFLVAGLNYFKFRRELTDEVALTLMEAPVFYLYSVPGAQLEEEFEANPIFQNRSSVALNFSTFERKVNLSLPLQLFFTRHRDYDAEAEHNNAWTTFLAFAPEVNYAFTPGFSAGIAVISPNLLDTTLAEHSVNHGRTTALTQLILRAEI